MACADCAESQHVTPDHLEAAIRVLTDQLGDRLDSRLNRLAELYRRPSPVAVEPSNRIVTGSVILPANQLDPVLLVPASPDRQRVSLVLTTGATIPWGFVQIHATADPPVNRGVTAATANNTGFALKGANAAQPYNMWVFVNTAAALWVSNPYMTDIARVDYIAEFWDPLQ